jgi:VCBS repeat-containing protein
VPTAPPITTDEDTDGTSQIAPNDPNTGDSFTYAVKTQGANGSASVSTTGLVTYKPNLNFNGTDSVTVTVTDSVGLSADVTINVTVNAVNDPPVAVGSIAAQSATVGTAFGPLDVSGNFSDPDSTLTYSLSGLPAGTGLTIDSSTGVITGTPTDADANAPQPIKVTVSATDGSTPATQPFDLTVNSTSSTSTTSNHNGSGCTLSTGDAGKDPLMPALVLTAIVSLYRRRRRSEKC